VVPDDGLDDDALIGRRAVDWLFGRPTGGSFFDRTLTGVTRTFGHEAGVGAFAPLGVNAEATDFFLVVEGRIDHDADWERLISAHRSLFDETTDPKRWARRRVKQVRDPFAQFHLVMEPHPLGRVPAEEAARAWLELA
jgi:hypothetical protein